MTHDTHCQTIWQILVVSRRSDLHCVWLQSNGAFW